MSDVHTAIDYGRCDRCRHFSQLRRDDTFERYAAGICHWKWRSCSPYDAVPLVANDSHCEAFEQRRTPTVAQAKEKTGD